MESKMPDLSSVANEHRELKILTFRPEEGCYTEDAQEPSSDCQPRGVLRKTISERNQRESPLLRLPAEIRNSIYEYVLGGQIIDIHADVDYPCGMPELVPEMRLGLSPNVSPRYHQKHPLALLEACHQIHSEAAPILFSTAVFNYGGHVDIETWDATNDLPVQPTVVTALLIRTVDEMLKEDRINELKYFPALKRIYVLDNIEGNQISDDKMKRFDDMNTLSKIKQHSNPDVVVLTSKRGSER